MKNRVALVTGAGRGIGEAIALQFATLGARVAITARSQAELDRVAAAGKAKGGTMFPIVADLTDSAAPAKIIEAVSREFGPPEILVNNAGIGSSGEVADLSAPKPRAIADFDDSFWDLTMKVNLTAPYVLTKLALPEMVKRRAGRLIYISSVNATIPGLFGSAYTASKHGLAGLMKVAAIEYAEFGITSNAICPGVTGTKLNDRRLEFDSKRLNTTVEALKQGSTPLGRRLEPDEVASLAVYLASDAASGVNGQSINVCGGRVFG
jgi:NAD(P)-dependent dehydrogenase (short-subunit alcohol dehydrogenase family)